MTVCLLKTSGSGRTPAGGHASIADPPPLVLRWGLSIHNLAGRGQRRNQRVELASDRVTGLPVRRATDRLLRIVFLRLARSSCHALLEAASRHSVDTTSGSAFGA